jgi:predicted nuclease with RNAse H fold
MNCIGLDVGFAAKRRSTGVARLSGGTVSVGCATASWDSRKVLCGIDEADVVAIDAPILASDTYDKRACERLFTLGCFQRRCKPGLSHVAGTGRDFRRAGHEAARQLSQVTSRRELNVRFPRVWKKQNIVEAFPNAFMGVLLPIKCFDGQPKIPRGKKFEWLYEQSLQQETFDTVVDVLGKTIASSIRREIKTNRNHDQKAALICLLTATLVVVGRYTAIGDANGGYLFLPPWEAWAQWARGELEVQRRRTDSVVTWINGKRWSSSETLPLIPGGKLPT